MLNNEVAMRRRMNGAEICIVVCSVPYLSPEPCFLFYLDHATITGGKTSPFFIAVTPHLVWTVATRFQVTLPGSTISPLAAPNRHTDGRFHDLHSADPYGQVHARVSFPQP
jgi:hypothetical protein